MRHYGEYDREAAVLLGYNTVSGRVLVLQLSQISEVDQQWLAGFVGRNQKQETLTTVMMAETYNGMNAFNAFGGRALQIPLHLVKIGDRQQCESWTGSSAQFSDRIANHPFLGKVQEAMPNHAHETYRDMAVLTPNAPLATGADYQGYASAPKNDQLEDIKMMLSGIMSRMAVLETQVVQKDIAKLQGEIPKPRGRRKPATDAAPITRRRRKVDATT